MKYGISIAIFPTLWEFGKVRIRDKSLLAIGPFRFCIHRVKGSLADYKSTDV